MNNIKIIVEYEQPKNVYSIGYCDLQFLLSYQNKVGYNSGIYGWNYDVFAIGDVAICTGYRNMPGVSVDHKLIRKYNEKARTIVSDWNIPYEQKKKKVNNLLHKFIEAIQN